MKFCQNGQHVEPTTNVANVLPWTANVLTFTVNVANVFGTTCVETHRERITKVTVFGTANHAYVESIVSCNRYFRYHMWNLLNKTEHASRTFVSFLSGWSNKSSCLQSVLLSFSKSQSLASNTKSCCVCNPPRAAVFTTSSQSFGSDTPKILQLLEAMSMAMELIHSPSRGEKRTKSEYRAKT